MAQNLAFSMHCLVRYWFAHDPDHSIGQCLGTPKKQIEILEYKCRKRRFCWQRGQARALLGLAGIDGGALVLAPAPASLALHLYFHLKYLYNISTFNILLV